MRDTMPEKLSIEYDSLTQDSTTDELDNSLPRTELSEEDRRLMKSNYGVQVFLNDCKLSDIDESLYPYDCFLITYQIDSRIYNDLARGPKRVKVFDAYYDTLNPIGGEVLQIKGWYGKINPKLWGSKPAKKRK
jgi:hypothetical protein